MKRLSGLWDRIVSMENLEEAAKNACSSRKNKQEVASFKADQDNLLEALQASLINHTYRSSKYRMFDVREHGKVRHIADLPLYPDRICHWAIALVVEEPLNRKLIDQTHASRPGHGIHSAIADLKDYIENDRRIRYCLQTDVKKFFPSIDKEVLKERMRQLIKDEDLLWLFDEIIDSYPESGIAIGNRVSPLFANHLLSPLDHLMKEKKHVHYYVRYMDDIVILGYSKPWLHKMRQVMQDYLQSIGLELKGNYKVFPVDSVGIQFVGYRVYTDHVLLRKNIKKNLKRKARDLQKKVDSGQMLDKHDLGTIASYKGFLKWCNGQHLYQMTLLPVEQKNSLLVEKAMNELIDKPRRRLYEQREQEKNEVRCYGGSGYDASAMDGDSDR